MIAKIKSGKHFSGVINYNETKVNQKQGSILGRENMPAYRGQKAAAYLERNGQLSRVKKQVLHISLNFSKADEQQLNDRNMLAIGKEYMEKMGLKEHPYIVYRHTDTEHPHLHIVASKIHPISNKKVIERNDRYRSKKITTEIEKSYGLTRTRALKNADESTFNRINHIKDKLDTSANHPLFEKDIKKAFQQAPMTFSQLNKSLAKNESVYRVKAHRNGIIYYKVDEAEQQNSATWKGALYKSEGLDKKGLSAVFAQHKKEAVFIKRHIEQIFEKPKSAGQQRIPLAHFERQLSEQGIEVQYAISKNTASLDEGANSNTKAPHKIFGLSYQYNRKVFKASAVDRKLSWNQLKHQLEFPSSGKMMAFRKALQENIKEGQAIYIEVNTQANYSTKANQQIYRFQSSNPFLQEALNTMENEAAFQIVQIHNDFIKQRNADDLTSTTHQKTPPSNYMSSNLLASRASLLANLAIGQTDKILRKLEEEDDQFIKRKKEKFNRGYKK